MANEHVNKVVYGGNTLIDLTDDTVSPETLICDITAHNASGQQIVGTVQNNGALSLTIDGLMSTNVSIPSGFTSGGTVSLTNAIEQALAAI